MHSRILDYRALSRHGPFDPIAVILERGIRRFHKARRRYSTEEFPLHLIKKSSDCSFPCVYKPTCPPHVCRSRAGNTRILRLCRVSVLIAHGREFCGHAYSWMRTHRNHAHFKQSGSPQRQRKKVKVAQSVGGRSHRRSQVTDACQHHAAKPSRDLR